jgi:cysteine desulfurase
MRGFANQFAGQGSKFWSPNDKFIWITAATTPVDPRVGSRHVQGVLLQTLEILPVFTRFGQQARAAVDRARREVAVLIGARQNELIFVSGGTEANNLAIRGLCEAARQHGQHIVTSNIEHPSVRGVLETLEKRGWEVTRIPVSEKGIVKIEDVRSALRPETVLVSVMLANNEIGTIQPIVEIGSLIRERRHAAQKNLWFHTDAVQAAGRIQLNVDEIGCDLLSLSGHKLYAPKGIGALYVRRGVRIFGQNVGGHQERERRAGTENVPAIVALGEAARIAHDELEQRSIQVRRLRDQFEAEVTRRIDDAVMNGDRDLRLPHLSNISFRYIEGRRVTHQSGSARRRSFNWLGMFVWHTRAFAGDTCTWP